MNSKLYLALILIIVLAISQSGCSSEDNNEPDSDKKAILTVSNLKDFSLDDSEFVKTENIN